jgi:ABC-type phosphate/phosphonate transport system substrate-binding protein
MIASLPMYDWPETQGINDVLWARISAKLDAANIDAPNKLARPQDLDALWLSPGLLLAQTCSYPLETVLRGRVQYVSTPTYGVEGCEKPGHYRSVILKRGTALGIDVPPDNNARLPDWLPYACLAFNGTDSMSGYHALKRDAEAAGRSLPTLQIKTGSHRESIIAVADGTADICAVDCVTWAMAKNHEPASAEVYVAGWTKERPGLPLITSIRTEPAKLSALRAASRSVLGAVVLKQPTEF